jgi:hypothetical protein
MTRRTPLTINNGTHLGAFPIRRRNHRCCSFCRIPGHTINVCNDPRIEETWKYCLREVDLRLGNDMEEEALYDVDNLLRQLPLPFLRVLGVQVGHIPLRSSIDSHITVIKNAICQEAEYFMSLRSNETIEYLNWLDPDSYDFEADEETDSEDVEESEESNVLNEAFIEEDPVDITHFAFFDRIPMILDDIEEYEDIFDEQEEEHIVTNITIEPMLLCLETATQLSALLECVVCLDEKTVMHFDTTNCGHSFCHSCICHHLDTSKNGPTCPNCRTIIRTLEVKDVDNYEDIVKRYGEKEELVSQSILVQEETDSDWLAPSGLSIYI